uniref:Uncharacterized protein n=1 Tax=Utricularia reniformis TaxID=192314 RepID=A0A1Y0B354_9LAMI|nr:hypothetical protein AEK19_MT1644 [Utricularia reniformis]ART31828.1 hypothetical protein AEK19_MT1644 [Utricularia reniformis]
MGPSLRHVCQLKSPNKSLSLGRNCLITSLQPKWLMVGQPLTFSPPSDALKILIKSRTYILMEDRK